MQADEQKLIELHQLINSVQQRQTYIGILSAIAIVFVVLLAVIFVTQTGSLKGEVLINREVCGSLDKMLQENQTLLRGLVK